MPTYRCYSLNNPHMRMLRRDIDAPNDGEAIVVAARLLDNAPIEVWRGTYLIGTVKPARKKLPLDLFGQGRA